MFQKTFNFSKNEMPCVNEIRVDNYTLYEDGMGYGFFTEETQNKDEKYQILELNTGFEPWYWLKHDKLTKLIQDGEACCLDKNEDDTILIPLSFKCDVPRQGNYKVTIGIHGSYKQGSRVMIFSGRKRLMANGVQIHPNTYYEQSFIVNVCDIIPRGKVKAYEDRTLDVTIIGDNARISLLKIEEIQVPTIYIAGDSTVTDQGASYPYVPGAAYCGWASMLPCFISGELGLSNHSHSGLTTLSFIEEGHYKIVEDNIKPGDYFFVQFGHNDQKLPNLDAYGGYADELERYVIRTIENGATPVIITPIARNTWRGSDGSYNDLLGDYAKACFIVGEKHRIKVIDLHGDFMKKIKELGLEQSKLYFFPKDYTHTNDYGGYLAASFVASGLKSANIKGLSEHINLNLEEFNPPNSIVQPIPSKEFKGAVPVEPKKVHFKDIDNSIYKNEITSLAERGIIPNDEENFCPNDPVTRVEALAYISKAVSFVPTNVYNDMYTDVLGHEWYAGVVECAYQNDMVDASLIQERKFFPLKPVTWEELCSFLVNAYKSRKETHNNSLFHEELIENNNILSQSASWSKGYIKDALNLGFITKDIFPQSIVLREEAMKNIYKLAEMV